MSDTNYDTDDLSPSSPMNVSQKFTVQVLKIQPPIWPTSILIWSFDFSLYWTLSDQKILGEDNLADFIALYLHGWIWNLLQSL